MISKVKSRYRFLSVFELKILACLFMLIDHVGVVLLVQYEWMRIVGRLSYPLFAFCIAEGCRYTKNKLRRFLSVFALGVICEIAFVVTQGMYIGNILLTFSISILLIYLLQYAKKEYLVNTKNGALLFALFAVSVVLTFVFCRYVGVEYGFFGVMTPVFVTLFDDVSKDSANEYKNKSKRLVSCLSFSVSLLMMSLLNPPLGSIQMWCLLSVLLVLFYNGQKGRYSFKYGFYLFYPIHILMIQGIYVLM